MATAAKMYGIIRTYQELAQLKTFSERYNYLKLDGVVGAETFGVDRYLNQRLYHSEFWKQIRDRVIARDLACDLGIENRDLHSRIIIHHMNPLEVEDVRALSDKVVNEDYLICCSHNTHMAIHYGDESKLEIAEPIVRTPYDTCPWKGVRP